MYACNVHLAIDSSTLSQERKPRLRENASHIRINTPTHRLIHTPHAQDPRLRENTRLHTFNYIHHPTTPTLTHAQGSSYTVLSLLQPNRATYFSGAQCGSTCGGAFTGRHREAIEGAENVDAHSVERMRGNIKTYTLKYGHLSTHTHTHAHNVAAKMWGKPKKEAKDVDAPPWNVCVET